MIKQLKNRWGDISYYKRFVVGIDRSKMKLYDLEEGAQAKVQSEAKNKQNKHTDTSKEDAPIFDSGKFSQDWENITPVRKKKSFNTEGNII
jgi:hypothetical protein